MSDIDNELRALDERDARAHPPLKMPKTSLYSITNRGTMRRVIYDGIPVNASNPAAALMRQIEIEPGKTVEARVSDDVVDQISMHADEPLRFTLAAKKKPEPPQPDPKFRPAT